MKKVQTALIFSAILAVTIGTLSYSGISATSLVTSSVPRNSDAMNILGHVEYTVRDSDGLVKAYYQSDNLVVNTGDNCVAARLFDPAGSGPTNHGCTSFGSTGYQFIAIGNQTAQFDDASTNLIAAATSSVDGEQARRRDSSPTFTASSGNSTTGAQVIIETPTPFTFSTSNATTVQNSALFNATAGAVDGNGQTTSIGTARAFAIQKLSPTVTVASGDTLNVRWTITIGGGDAQSGP
ncbi:MAG: hypothetical protein WAO91_09940 [Candidatus Nitrosotenuis sp.]